MREEQLLRIITSLSSLRNNGCSVHSIDTELVPSHEDPDFLDPVIVIEYHRSGQTGIHKVKVYDDGSASDF